MDNDSYVYINNQPDPRKNLNRYWLTRKGRNIGSSKELDEELSAWMWSNTDYHRGQIIVNTIIGYVWGKYPATKEGISQMKKELGGRKIWETYEDGDDFHIVLWGQTGDDRPVKAVSKTPHGQKKIRTTKTNYTPLVARTRTRKKRR